MGLDAFVRCNCWEEGRTTPPPVPVDFIYLDEEGYLSLNLPYRDNEEQHHAFDYWRARCCEHDNMEYVSVHVSNWGGYRSFQQALGKAGWEHFPTLRAELPNANGGQLLPASAARALQELRYFQERADLGSNTFLIDTETGEDLHEHIESYQGVFTWSGQAKVDLGVDERGFFIIATGTEPHHEEFRSVRFEQRLLEPELTESYRGGQVAYIDLNSGRRFVCKAAVSGKDIPWPDGRMQNDRGQVRRQYPRFLHVERRKIAADDFVYILEPLTQVFQAAVTVGNPVQWC